MAKRKDEDDADSADLVCFVPSGASRPKKRSKYKKVVSKCPEELDTNVFECHLENLWRRISEKKRKLFAYFDCLWYSLYTNDSSRARVLNWIKGKHIFAKKYVFVPIVKWRHWSLLVLCHFGDCSPTNSRTPCMLLLDSLGMTNPKRLESGIRKFVLDIYRIEDRPEKEDLIYRIPLLVPKVPQQRNHKECGNYVLYFINLFVESAPENFSIFEGYPYFMKEDWFSPDSLECFCKELDSDTLEHCKKVGSDMQEERMKLDSDTPDYAGWRMCRKR